LGLIRKYAIILKIKVPIPIPEVIIPEAKPFYSGKYSLQILIGSIYKVPATMPNKKPNVRENR
jgi:hypothetical protein